MSNDFKLSNDRDTATGSQSRTAAPLKASCGLTLESTPPKAANEPRSSDPYNTSGSFDRTKNWARVGKR